MSSNEGRIFESVVSVDAWHTTFSPDESVASVHVDVSFLRGKLGDGPDSPVRFEIGLKRAEVLFVVPANEPLKVLQSSVRRERPITVRSEVSTAEATKGMARGAASLDIARAAANLNAEVSGQRAVERTETTSSLAETGPATWAQSKNADGHYRWEFAPTVAKILLGKAWDPISEPLLQIRTSNSAALEPVCRIEVHCRREDLMVTNIEVKDASIIQRLMEGRVFENKMAVIEAYIRNALSSRNLDVRNFEDPYGDILLADVRVEDQIS